MEKFNFEQLNVLKEERSESQRKLDNLISGSIENGDRQQLRDLIISGYINREYFNRLLKKYCKYNVEYKNVLRVDEMIDLLIPENNEIDKKTLLPNFEHIDEVFLPTNGKASIKKGEEKFKELVRIPRIQMFIDLLNDIGITPDKYDCFIGQNDQGMIRTLSYAMFILKNINKMFFICNEEGNATYIIYGQCDNKEKYYSLSKDEIQNLVSNNFGKKIIWKNEESWTKEILEEMENASNTDISKLLENEFHKLIKKERKEDFYHTYEEAKEAVGKLGLRSQEEYYKGYINDSRLISHPHIKYKDKGWNGWSDFLRNETKEYLYSTYEEAKAAVQKLDIKTSGEYMRRYKEDLKLTSHPHEKYKDVGWNGWSEFLRNEEKKDLYGTYEEAKEAVGKLGITSQLEYNKRYKEDSRLTSHPHEKYKGIGWSDWYKYLGNEKREDFYPTFEKAKEAVQRLGIKSSGEYKKRYNEDLELPPHPENKYKDIGWDSWPDFFGKEKREKIYETIEEAMDVVKRLGIYSLALYHKMYKEDSRLPSSPYQVYKDKGWKDWPTFLGRSKK